MIPFNDITTFFFILLGGFMMVNVYRRTIQAERTLGDFEYLGLSAFWGMALMVLVGYLMKIKPLPEDLILNPFSIGFVMAILGALIARLGGEISNASKKKNRN